MSMSPQAERTDAIRVLCVDDHELLAEGLAARMALERDLTCVGRASTAADLLQVVRSTGAQVVLLDLDMPGPDPFEELSALLRAIPNVKVIILSAHVRDFYIDTAFERGACGYFSKGDAPDAILDGIRRVMAGEVALSPVVAERLGVTETTLNDRRHGSSPAPGEARSPLSLLTPRELEVLRLVGKGMARADIARALHRSLKTIDAHHTAIMRKLDIHDRAELTRYAIREGLVEA